MRQTELHLSEEARSIVEGIRAKGLHQSREVNRAHILSSLDRGVPESQIMDVLGVGRTAVWRTRAAYLQGVWIWHFLMWSARGVLASTTQMQRR